ncbi:MAG: hypothetical protein E5Y32_13220 [Mesorhizobium sp.]|uniref:hypothetical protein n=1 Tax=Mesorhizobium sp. TaxID=1871066 RepID=UPI00122B8F3D|nr:hypothetical protein [Mesorhizobium sp.]TIL56906.1 MAG: hypothetical protein E5Y79_27410 [Mesorhizobium sp.]TIM13540.1 MAG: hypothetical protein E5Y67_16905 [Mesorhizobium sp.]TIN45537.1 MAG: hypothetical protein E5Y32_13220 [Mesorhizobium sp.]
MRSNSARSRLRAPVSMAIVLVAVAIGFAAPARAGTRDRVYADSFGNLVIESAAGYKRILVGEGELAKEMSDYVGAGRPKIVYQDEPGDVSSRDCYRPPVFVKGRSYMYGLSDGEMPELSPCR